MLPLIWGTLFHDMCLFFASAFPDEPDEEEIESMIALLTNFFKRLPCQSPCAIEAVAYMKEFPFSKYIKSRKTLLEYLVTFHNHLNAKDGKKSDWTVLEALTAAHARHGSSIRALSRADQVRCEDHKMIYEIATENNKLRDQLHLPMREDVKREFQDEDYDFSKYYRAYDPNEPRIDISTVAIVVCSLLLFFIIIMAVIG